MDKNVVADGRMSNKITLHTGSDQSNEKASDNQKTEKRPDLQGLRTVAITAVLLFHIWPEQFPNGYLGVDMQVFLNLLIQ